MKTNWPTKKPGEIFIVIVDFIKTHPLSIVWFIFTGLFFYMAWREWNRSKKNIKSLENMLPSLGGQAVILGINFAEVIQKFKAELNNSNKESHRIAATAYFLAGLTAFISFIVSLL